MTRKLYSILFSTLMLFFTWTNASSALDCLVFDKPGTYTWVVPHAVHEVLISAAAGGAGGAGSGYYSPEDGPYSGAGGGGGASILKKKFTVTPGMKVEIIVGKGGAMGLAGSTTQTGTAGTNGTATTIGSFITLQGWKTAKRTSPPVYAGFRTPGEAGGIGGQRGFSPQYYDGGKGGDTLLGFGGSGGNAASPRSKYAGEDGINGGGGGGGGGSCHPPAKNFYSNGGRGGDGIVIIEWRETAIPQESLPPPVETI